MRINAFAVTTDLAISGATETKPAACSRVIAGDSQQDLAEYTQHLSMLLVPILNCHFQYIALTGGQAQGISGTVVSDNPIYVAVLRIATGRSLDNYRLDVLRVGTLQRTASEVRHN